MGITNWIGSLAGILTTVAFIPQVAKTWKTRSTDDISLLMFLLFNGGVLLWLIYGVLLHSTPIIVANSITFCLSMSILTIKINNLIKQRRRALAADQRSL